MEDSYLLDRWDHTSLIVTGLQHVTAVMANAWGKGKKTRPITFDEVHPYRRRSKGLKITKENFKSLKGVIGGLQRRR